MRPHAAVGAAFIEKLSEAQVLVFHWLTSAGHFSPGYWQQLAAGVTDCDIGNCGVPVPARSNCSRMMDATDPCAIRASCALASADLALCS